MNLGPPLGRERMSMVSRSTLGDGIDVAERVDEPSLPKI